VLFKARWISALRHRLNSTAEQMNELLGQGVKPWDGMTKDEMNDYMGDLLSRQVGLMSAASLLICGDEIKDFPWEFTDVHSNYNYLEGKRLISVNSLREYFDYVIPLCNRILVDLRRITTDI
jgi:hypothetical protein